jgi:integrase
VGTLRALLEKYFEKGPGVHHRRADRDQQLLRTVFAKLLDKPAFELQRLELQLIADDWRSPATASLAVRLLRPCLKWAEKRQLTPAGLGILEQPGRVGKRERVLTRAELRAIWPCLTGMHGCVMKWLLWTGCRLNEAAAMTWNEITGDTWTIPAAHSKSGRPRVVPLPLQAADMLQELKRGEPGLVFPSKGGGLLSNWHRVTKRVHASSQTLGWHRHDLRRTVATMLGDLGFEPHVISVVLGHSHIAEGATAVYARSRYGRQHREALQALADDIDEIVTQKSNVIRFSAR